LSQWNPNKEDLKKQKWVNVTSVIYSRDTDDKNA
jgi:hypothetical protein